MGKNQTHKLMQKSKVARAGGGPEDEGNDGMVDGTFHSPEWHAARLASLQVTHTLTWEEYKKKQREDARKQEELEGDEQKRMMEYRAQLDAERALKLAKGKNHAGMKEKLKKKEKKERRKDKKKGEERKRKKKRSKREDSESETSESEEDGKERRKDQKKSKRSSSRKKRRSKSEDSSESSEDEGPVRLSSFFSEEKKED